MHPAIIYIKKENGELLAEVTTKLAFTPELNTVIYYNKTKARVAQVVVDITPAIPAIVITAIIK